MLRRCSAGDFEKPAGRAIYPRGWGLVRASNTQEVLVLRFEADTEKDLEEIESEVKQVIEDVIQRLGQT